MNHFLSKVYHFKRSAMALSQDENNGTDQKKSFFIKAGKNGNLIYLLGRKLHNMKSNKVRNCCLASCLGSVDGPANLLRTMSIYLFLM